MEQDLQAISAFQSGDSEAFGELYDRYIRKIYDFIFFRTSHKETAEDLTSQVFTKALEKLGTFKSGKGTFQAWLFRIARNTVIDHYRTNKPTSDIDEVAPIADSVDLPEEIDVKELNKRVLATLQGMQADHREIILFRVYDGLPYKEIADILGKSEASCKMSFSRAVAKLRVELGSEALLLLIPVLMTNYYG